jgi:adenylate cyclase
MSCPDCSTPRAPGARFCHQCGRKLEPPSTTLRVGDRRVVTALFADLVGYTKLVDELDPEEVRSRVDAAFGVLGESVAHFGGSLEKFVGDAVLAVFGAPAAHDDDALRGCLCALEMQSSLSRLGEGGDRPLKLRVGISTGEVVAAVRDLSGINSIALTGECMTTAARLQQLADPEEIMLDNATVLAAGPRVGAELVGNRMLRGKSRPIEVYRLRDERRRAPNVTRQGVRLVGRDAERARLADLIKRAAASGKGGAALLRGEAGIGKSRILLEMEPVARAAGFGWIWVDNAPHLIDSPYRAVRSIVDWLADEKGVNPGKFSRELLFGSGADEDTKRLMMAAVTVLAHDSDMVLLPEDGWIPPAAGLADPADLARALRLATDHWITSLVAEQPRVVVIDDFHWLDPSSRLLMDELVRISGDLPLVVLSGTRPPLMPEWVGLPHVEVIELGGLDPAATEELGMIVAGAELEPESASWLYERTAGNALFVGEIMRMLRAGGRISRVHDRLRIDSAAAQRSMPLSLRALLGARIDALPPAPRSAIQVAAVIGVTFSDRLLGELMGGINVADDLRQLVDAGILVSGDAGADGSTSETARSEGGCWRFRHQLFHDAAYGRLLTDRRRQLHTALADRLESGDPPVQAAELARHRLAAGDVVRALPLLERAALEAEAVSALEEAASFRKAAESLRREHRFSDAVS